MRSQTKVGLLFLAVLVSAGIVLVNLGNVPFLRRGYRFNVIFDNVSDLPQRAPVKMSGIDIGRVAGMRLHKGMAKVTLWIEDRYRIRSDTRARILRMGLIGSTYMSLTQGSEDAPFIEDGDTIKGESPIDYEALVEDVAARAGDAIERIAVIIEELDIPGELIEDVAGAASGLRSVSQSLERALGDEGKNLARVLEDISLLAGDIREVVSGAGEEISKVSAGVETAAAAMDELQAVLGEIRSGRGAAGKFITSPEVERQVGETIESIHAVSLELREAAGRFGGFESSVEAGTYYDLTDEEFISSGVLTLRRASRGRYFSVGLENIGPDSDSVFAGERRNSLTLLAGKGLGPLDIYGGAIRSSGGVGARWRASEFIEFEGSIFDFNRERPWMRVGARLKLAGFINAVFSGEDILDERRMRGGLEVEIK